jgi:hypothetical protein
MSEIVIEGAVFLGDDNDVLDGGDVVSHLGERRVDSGILIVRDR